MINEFQGIGNVGSNPSLSSVVIDNETRKVANMRVYFDRPVGEEFQDKGGFWLTTDIWGFRAEEAVRTLKKGARVFMSGTLREDTWIDESTAEEKTQLRMRAEYFFVDTICVDEIVYRNNKDSAPEKNTAQDND